jgi:hypothetical protein
MKKLNLNICGAGKTNVGLDEVFDVTMPQRTETYVPVSHKLVIDEVRNHLEENNFQIVDENHHLHRFGQRYFGLMQVQDKLAPENPDRATIVGMRNSYDKSFPAGLMAGDAPFVCSNLIFSNEIVLSRRHTNRILDRNIAGNIFMKIAMAVGQMREKWQSQDRRVDSYKEYDLSSNTEAHDLILKAFRAGACSKTKIADVLEQWHNPNHSEFSDRNLYSLYNAFSEVTKSNLVDLPKRSQALHSVFDGVATFDIESSVIDVDSEVLETA